MHPEKMSEQSSKFPTLKCLGMPARDKLAEVMNSNLHAREFLYDRLCLNALSQPCGLWILRKWNCANYNILLPWRKSSISQGLQEGLESSNRHCLVQSEHSNTILG